MKNIVCMAAACVVLAGCQITPPGGVKRTRPAYSDYTAYVTVVNGRPYVYPEAIVVRDKNVHIYWYVDVHSGHRFTTDGIVIVDHDGEFTDCKSGAPGGHLDGGMTYRCHDKNNKHDAQNHPRGYKYTIKLEPAGGGTPIILDPWVVND
jgi:hypothetical protein